MTRARFGWRICSSPTSAVVTSTKWSFPTSTCEFTPTAGFSTAFGKWVVPGQMQNRLNERNHLKNKNVNILGFRWLCRAQWISNSFRWTNRNVLSKWEPVSIDSVQSATNSGWVAQLPVYCVSWPFLLLNNAITIHEKKENQKTTRFLYRFVLSIFATLANVNDFCSRCMQLEFSACFFVPVLFLILLILKRI